MRAIFFRILYKREISYDISRTSPWNRAGGSFSFFLRFFRLFFPSKLPKYLFLVSHRPSLPFISLHFFPAFLLISRFFYSHTIPTRFAPQHFTSYLSISQTFPRIWSFIAFYLILPLPRAFQFPPFVTLVFTSLLSSSSFPLLETHSRVGLLIYFLPGTALVFRFAPRSRTDIVLSSRKRHPVRAAPRWRIYTYIRRATINYYRKSTIKLRYLVRSRRERERDPSRDIWISRPSWQIICYRAPASSGNITSCPWI